jgi:hypothetical protein
VARSFHGRPIGAGISTSEGEKEIEEAVRLFNDFSMKHTPRKHSPFVTVVAFASGDYYAWGYCDTQTLKTHADDLRVGYVRAVAVPWGSGEVGTFPGYNAPAACTVGEDDVLEPAGADMKRGSK